MANRGRPKGYQVSKETRKKISEGNKGKKQSESSKQRISQSKKGTSTWNKGKAMSEETKRKMSLSKTKNRKCSIEGCENKHQAHGFCKSHWGKHRRANDPEYRDKMKKKGMADYFKHHEKRKLAKNTRQKFLRADIYKKLGGKCESCGEKFNPDLRKSNLVIHHRFYDEDDMLLKKKYKGSTGSKHHWEVKKMLENGISTKKKFGLLCCQCNSLEGFVKMNTSKAFETFCWLYGEGYFDKALKDDPRLKKLSEFMN